MCFKNIEILYEDKELIVLDKPSGLTVHPGAGQKNYTLVDFLIKNNINHVFFDKLIKNRVFSDFSFFLNFTQNIKVILIILHNCSINEHNSVQFLNSKENFIKQI